MLAFVCVCLCMYMCIHFRHEPFVLTFRDQRLQRFLFVCMLVCICVCMDSYDMNTVVYSFGFKPVGSAYT